MQEFGGEGECGAVRWAAAEPAVGGFWHGRGREGKRARDEVCGPEPERGREDGSGAREGEHVAEGARGQGSNRIWPGGGGGWAKLLARVFALDITRCRKCGGRMRVLEVVSDPDAIARILHGARAPPAPHPPGQLLLLP